MTRKIKIQAILIGSSVKREIAFDLHIFPDCSNYLKEDVLDAALEKVDGEFKISRDVNK